MIGLDTSHAVAFTVLLNDPQAPGHVPGARVTAAFRWGSPELPEKSLARLEGFATELQQRYGVELCDSVDAVLERCDAVMIESVDGRQHLAIARAVFPARKPVFIDKPLAGSLADGLAMAQLARAHGVPWFSASALRFAPAVTRLSSRRDAIRGAVALSPCEIEPHHPDLFWYGIHGVEMLYALLGAGCESVSRVAAPNGDVVTGRWRDGRLGVFYGHRGTRAQFGFEAVLPTEIVAEPVAADYAPLVRQIVEFFQQGRAPVSSWEMIEVLAFMEAADESKRRDGAPVPLSDMLRIRGGAPLSAPACSP